MIEQRRHTRSPIDVPVTIQQKGEDGVLDGVAKDISLGGMSIETSTPAKFGSEVTVRVTLPTAKGEMALPGVVRWVRGGGMGVQFGLLGAVETHAITQMARGPSSR
ncbi:MAG: PilZ domain-containing protein [Myxococcales bacterium]|nr:PilZ domain-containing protein [Myxococcales bacterium]